MRKKERNYYLNLKLMFLLLEFVIFPFRAVLSQLHNIYFPFLFCVNSNSKIVKNNVLSKNVDFLSSVGPIILNKNCGLPKLDKYWHLHFLDFRRKWEFRRGLQTIASIQSTGLIRYGLFLNIHHFVHKTGGIWWSYCTIYVPSF